ncbi:MAG TPA: hypothetical protein VIY98_11425 [Nitrososphaeraceae archaeon]
MSLLVLSPDKFIYASPNYHITQNQDIGPKLNYELYDITLDNTFYNSKLLSFKIPIGWGITHEKEQSDFLHLDLYPKNDDQAQILIVSSNTMLYSGVEELLPSMVETMFKQSVGDDKKIEKIRSFDIGYVIDGTEMNTDLYKIFFGNNSVMTVVVYGLIDSDSMFIAYFMSPQYDKYLPKFEQLMNNINFK